MQMFSIIGHGRLRVNDSDGLTGDTPNQRYIMHDTAGEATLGKLCSSSSPCTGLWRKTIKEAASDIQDEPLYSVDCVIDAIHLALAKTQFEQLLRALEHISSYGIFVDSTLNHRAIQLRDFFKARKMTEE